MFAMCADIGIADGGGQPFAAPSFFAPVSCIFVTAQR
jgi:hypothetical protein